MTTAPRALNTAPSAHCSLTVKDKEHSPGLIADQAIDESRPPEEKQAAHTGSGRDKESEEMPAFKHRLLL